MLLKNCKLKYLKASSLLESVMAITILSVCGLIGIRLYASVLDNSYSYEYLNATSKINNLIFQTQHKKQIGDQDFKFDKFEILKEIENTDKEYIKVNFSGNLQKDTIKKSIKIYNFSDN